MPNTNKTNNKNNNFSTGISVKGVNVQNSIKKFLELMGEDLNREGIKNTPKRFEETLRYLLSGYDRRFEDETTTFENKVKYKDLILLKNIDFMSLCEHHFLPFFGYAHIGYIPSQDGYFGISKLARVVDIYSRRLQDQERLSYQIAQALIEHGGAKGVAILLESKHLCNIARGVEKKMSVMTTCAYYGSFENDITQQNKFLELIRDREKI